MLSSHVFVFFFFFKTMSFNSWKVGHIGAVPTGLHSIPPLSGLAHFSYRILPVPAEREETLRDRQAWAQGAASESSHHWGQWLVLNMNQCLLLLFALLFLFLYQATNLALHQLQFNSLAMPFLLLTGYVYIVIKGATFFLGRFSQGGPFSVSTYNRKNETVDAGIQCGQYWSHREQVWRGEPVDTGSHGRRGREKGIEKKTTKIHYICGWNSNI